MPGHSDWPNSQHDACHQTVFADEEAQRRTTKREIYIEEFARNEASFLIVPSEHVVVTAHDSHVPNVVIQMQCSFRPKSGPAEGAQTPSLPSCGHTDISSIIAAYETRDRNHYNWFAAARLPGGAAEQEDGAAEGRMSISSS
jgi:hypothetical protein